MEREAAECAVAAFMNTFRISNSDLNLKLESTASLEEKLFTCSFRKEPLPVVFINECKDRIFNILNGHSGQEANVLLAFRELLVLCLVAYALAGDASSSASTCSVPFCAKCKEGETIPTCEKCEPGYDLNEKTGLCIMSPVFLRCCEMTTDNTCKDDLCNYPYVETDDHTCADCVDYSKYKDGACVPNEVKCDGIDNCETCYADKDNKNQICAKCKDNYCWDGDNCVECAQCTKDQDGCYYCYGKEGDGDCVNCKKTTQEPDGKKCVDKETAVTCTKDQEHCKTCFDDGEGDCASCDCGYHVDGKKCKEGNVYNSANTVAIFAVVALLLIIF